MVLAGILVLVFSAAVAAAALRAARAPGHALLGGVLVGAMLGPGIAGRIAPRTWERVFVGGQAERLERDRFIGARDADAFVGAEAATLDTDLQAARDAWSAATWAHQRPLRITTLLVVAAVVLLAGLSAVPRDGPAPAPAAVASIAAWSAGIPAAIAAGLVFREPLPVILLTLAAVAIGPFALRDVDRNAAENAEYGGPRLVQGAGRVATLVALSAAAIALFTAGVGASALPLLAWPAGWLLRHGPRPLTTLRDAVLIPALGALSAIKLDLIADAAFWPIIVLFVAGGDGRWAGATIGAMLPGGRRWLRTMRLVMGSMACGPTQLAIVTIALHLEVLPRPLGLALLAGAVVIEVSAPLRRSMATRLAELEAEAQDSDA